VAALLLACDLWPMPSLTLEFLGTGTSQGVPVIGCGCEVCTSLDAKDKRLRTSALVRSGDTALLIDAGPDLRQQMLRSHVKHLDGVLLTHAHMDHVGGIDDLRAFNFMQKQAMDLYGSPATLNAVKHMFHYAFAAERYPGVPELRLKEIGAGPFRTADLEVRTVDVLHDLMPVLGFCLGGLAYITDAKTMDEDQISRLRGVDTLVLNALRKKEHPSHLNLREALELVERIGPRRAYFTHISHLLGTHAEVSGELPDYAALAYDGLVVEVPA
jgi:phosphoribosyl 1,2-cyclic phosphate phosphodiesterase